MPGRTDLEKLTYSMEVRMDKMEKDLKRARDQTDKSAKAIQARMRQMGVDVEGDLRRAMMRSAGIIGGALSVNAVKNLADGYTRYTNQLRLAGLEGSALAGVQDQLFGVAQKYGVELEGLGTLYSRLSQSSKDLHADQAQMLMFTNGVAAALKVQGGSASDSAGALMQLSQALGGGTVRAEEFNSILEGARPIAQAVANGIDRYKGSVSALRNEVIAGKVSSQEFFQGFLRGSGQLEAQAAKANLTIGASFTILNNALGKYIGEADASLSATQKVAQAIGFLAENLDFIVPAMTAIAVVIGGRYVGALTIATAANVANALSAIRLTAAAGGSTTAMGLAAVAARTMGASLLTAFGGPVGLAIAAITAAVWAYNAAIEASKKPSQEYQAATEDLNDALSDYEEAARAAAVASGKDADAAKATAAEKRKAAYAARDHAKALLAEAEAHLAVVKAQNAETVARGFDPEGYAGQAAAMGVRENKAEANYNAARKMLDDAQRRINAIEKPAPAVSGGGGGTVKKAPKGASGPTKQELADRREMLRLEQALEVATTEGATSRARGLEDEIYILRRKKEYMDAGRKADEAEFMAIKDRIALREAEATAAANVFSARPAEAGADPNLVAGLVDYVGPLIAQAGELKDTYAGIISDAFQAARYGGVEGFLQWFAQRLGDGALQALSEAAAQAAMENGGGSSGGSGWGAVLSIVAKAFGGQRANGGPVKAGMIYEVNERGQEFFSPDRDGKIIPHHGVQKTNAVRMPGGFSTVATGAGRGGVQVTQNIYADRSIMTPDIFRSIREVGLMAGEYGATSGGARGAAMAGRASARQQSMKIPR